MTNICVFIYKLFKAFTTRCWWVLCFFGVYCSCHSVWGSPRSDSHVCTLFRILYVTNVIVVCRNVDITILRHGELSPKKKRFSCLHPPYYLQWSIYSLVAYTCVTHSHHRVVHSTRSLLTVLFGVENKSNAVLTSNKILISHWDACKPTVITSVVRDGLACRLNRYIVWFDSRNIRRFETIRCIVLCESCYTRLTPWIDKWKKLFYSFI